MIANVRMSGTCSSAGSYIQCYDNTTYAKTTMGYGPLEDRSI